MGCLKLEYHRAESHLKIVHCKAEKEEKSYAGAYRFGFQGQEQDNELKGNGNSLAFKYRIHDPRLGRFLSLDPLADKYPFYSPYAFSGNRVIDAYELEGLEPIVVNGTLMGYHVQAGQGPTQIAADLNSAKTQEKYGYTLIDKVDWTDVVKRNIETFKSSGNYESKDWQKNSGDEGYTQLDINEGDALSLIPTQALDRTDITSQDNDDDTTPITNEERSGFGTDALSVFSDATAGAGAGFAKVGGDFRLTNGAYNGNAISPKFYPKGWGGGSIARITTLSSAAASRTLGRLGTAGALAVGAYNIRSSYLDEGGVGIETQVEIGKTAGGLGGGWAGAGAGASIGAFGGPPGALIGGILGGLSGGWAGAELGEGTVKAIQNSGTNTTTNKNEQGGGASGEWN